MDREQFLALWAAWYEFDNAARQMETASLANVTERSELLEEKRAECFRHMTKLHTTVAAQLYADERTQATSASQ